MIEREKALCQNECCDNLGTKSCAVCGDAKYCSAACQKEDWKSHRAECVNMNKLPTNLLSCNELDKLIGRMMRKSENLIILKQVEKGVGIATKSLIFAEHQYGTPVPGKSYYIRSNGDRADDYEICRIRERIAQLHDTWPSTIVKDEITLANMNKCCEMALIRRSEDCDTDKDMYILMQRRLCRWYLNKYQLDKAEVYAHESLSAAKLHGGQNQLDHICEAMSMLARLRGRQKRYSEAIAVAEETYIIASNAYGPVHPMVQTVAAQLIECLILVEDYAKAEDYCCINYESLIDPHYGMDPMTENVADGMMQLAGIWVYKEYNKDDEADVRAGVEALRLARKACSIIDRVASTNLVAIIKSLKTLCGVLFKLGMLAEEILIYQRIVSLCIEFFGSDSEQTKESIVALKSVKYAIEWMY